MCVITYTNYAAGIIGSGLSLRADTQIYILTSWTEVISKNTYMCQPESRRMPGLETVNLLYDCSHH